MESSRAASRLLCSSQVEMERADETEFKAAPGKNAAVDISYVRWMKVRLICSSQRQESPSWDERKRGGGGAWKGWEMRPSMKVDSILCVLVVDAHTYTVDRREHIWLSNRCFSWKCNAVGCTGLHMSVWSCISSSSSEVQVLPDTTSCLIFT